MNKKIGIALAGGGAKGAFAVGVLKVLLEKIKAEGDILHSISGTSIGAMNGAFVAAGQFSDLERIWLSWNNKNCPLIQSPWYGKFLAGLINGYACDPKSTRNFFIKNLSVNNLLNSPIRYINTMVRLGDGKLRLGGNTFQKVNPDLAIREIMASMAFIPATNSINIEGLEYVDGGYTDTVPVEALIDNNEKLDKIYVINLNPEKRKWNKTLVKNSNKSLLQKLLFVYDDIIWTENNRSDIELGKLKYWNSDEYHLIFPEFTKLSTINFDGDLIKEAYLHGIKIANKIK
jgi:predicted acylesterase/phospholipase RssA